MGRITHTTKNTASVTCLHGVGYHLLLPRAHLIQSRQQHANAHTQELCMRPVQHCFVFFGHHCNQQIKQHNHGNDIRAREQQFGGDSASDSLLRNGSAAYYPRNRQQRFEFKPVLSHGNNRLIHLPCSISTLAAGRADSQGSALCVLQVIVAKDARSANSSQRSLNDDTAPPPPRRLLRRLGN